MKPLVYLLAVLSLASAGFAAAAPPQAEREIEQLVTALGNSGCSFQRNGTWYNATQAQAHLRKKYQWLRKRDMVASAEQFIERAGSQSSLSGRAYQVRCPSKPVVPSAVWLGNRLKELREAVTSPH